MNKLSREARAQILGMMVEGVSIRAISRLTGASKNTVVKLLIDAGKACMAYHDANVRNVKAYFSVKRAKFDPRVPVLADRDSGLVEKARLD